MKIEVENHLSLTNCTMLAIADTVRIRKSHTRKVNNIAIKSSLWTSLFISRLPIRTAFMDLNLYLIKGALAICLF